MIRASLFFALALSSTQALAQSDHCTALYDKLRAAAPGDMSKCVPVIPEAKTKQCTLPSGGPSARQASHIVMILDASGSMAGMVSGEQKMAVAKREAGKFLSDLPSDAKIGLMVYGHRGTNQESGKAESCAAVEWAFPMGASRRKMKGAIEALSPTGWTPMGGALNFAKAELEKYKAVKGDKDSTPVVYLISDGEETCGGDPVAAAKAINTSGAKPIINVIGFDVDDKTRAQLEEISTAGGGRYFAAADSAALAAHLRAAADAVNSAARFEYCLDANRGLAEAAYHSRVNSVPACFVRENKRLIRDVILDKVKTFTAEADIACTREVEKLTRREWSKNNKTMVELYRKLNAEQRAAGKAARIRAAEDAIPAE